MREPSNDLDPIERMADSFLARFRAGERPSVEEYAARYPELADDIRELLPALVMIEQNFSIGGDTHGPAKEPLPAPGAGGVPGSLGDFAIVREIGRGGMGVVYEAVQQSLGRHVALKVLAWHNVRDSSHVERFRLEARAVARLHHTNIVPVFGVGEQQGTHYYAMQYIRGEGLDAVYHELKRLRASRPSPEERVLKGGIAASALARSLATDCFAADDGPRQGLAVPPAFDPSVIVADGPSSPDEPPADAASGSVTRSGVLAGSVESTTSADRHYYQAIARIGLQVAEALAYAHGQGILHRDIKPSNLLLDAQGTVWVTDFGLAKADGSDGPTRTGDIIGTLRYMAPERFDGRSDPRSDLYGLGATLYELLTLHPLFNEPTRARLIERVLRDDPTPPRRLEPNAPRDLETIVLKALAREPSSRYASAREMADDLRRFLDDQPIAARRVRAPERLWRLCRRNPVVSGLSAAVVALLVVVAVGASLAAARERAARLASERAKSDLERAWAEYRRARSSVETLRRTIDSQRAAYEADPTDAARQTLDTLYQRFATELQSGGRPADAAAVLWERRSLWPGEPDGLLDVARGLARLSASGQVPPYVADRAMDVLRRAALAGPAPLPDLNLDPAFAPLRNRDDFHMLAAAPRESAGGQAVARQLLGHEQPFVEDVALTADGRRALSVGQDATARLWSLEDGREVRRYVHDTAIFSVAILSDGRRLATACGISAWLWDLESGELIAKLVHPSVVWSVAATPDGRLLTGCHDNTVRLWDVETRSEVRRYGGGHRAEIRRLAVSADGRRFLSSSLDGKVCLWDSATGRLLHRLDGHRGPVWCVAFTPDGRRALTGGSDGRLIVWDLASGRVARYLVGHANWVRSVAVASDGRGVISGTQNGVMIAWDLDTGLERHRWFGPGGQVGLALAPDGRHAVTADNDRTVRLWLIAEDVAAARDQARLGHRTDAAETYTRALGSRPADRELAHEAARFLGPFAPEAPPAPSLDRLAASIPAEERPPGWTEHLGAASAGTPGSDASPGRR